MQAKNKIVYAYRALSIDNMKQNFGIREAADDYFCQHRRKGLLDMKPETIFFNNFEMGVCAGYASCARRVCATYALCELLEGCPESRV